MLVDGTVWGWGGVAALLPLFSPALILVFSHVIPHRWERRRWERSSTVAISPEQRLEGEALRGVQRRFHLTKPITCLRSPTCASPFVFGSAPGNALLVLPAHLSAQALRAAAGDRSLAAALVRLVIGHEVAYIRNGDIRFQPLSCAASLILPLVGVLGCGTLLLASSFAPASPALIVAKPMVGFLFGGAILLRLLVWAALPHRERLADATAALVVDETDLRRLVEPGSQPTDRYSPLERLLASHGLRQQLIRAAFGFGRFRS